MLETILQLDDAHERLRIASTVSEERAASDRMEALTLELIAASVLWW